MRLSSSRNADVSSTVCSLALQVMHQSAFRELLKRTGAVYMKGDWTNVDPTISAFLQEYHTPGVPLYVVFPKHGGPGRQLSTVLTLSLVEKALTAAAQ